VTHSTEEKEQSALLRDLLGPLPFRKVDVDPASLAWNHCAVVKLGQAVYDEQILPEATLDRTRLAVLGNVLEEAGCQNADVLGHLRDQDRAHVRGCWVLDLVLNKA
jgi:hypothetical protein